MNLSQLRAFVAVVEQRSFSGAAKALGLSQPAVTMQLQSLEAETGATLLDRRYRRVEPTEAGSALLPHARRILAELESARDDIDRLSERVTGRLDIAASTTPGQYVVPMVLGAFLREHAEVAVTLRIHDSAEVVAAVAAGEAHIGVTGARVDGARVDFAELGDDRLVMICPPGGTLADGADIPLADLVEEPFIMREQGSGTRTVTEEALRAGGIDLSDLRVLAELGTSEAIVNAVEGGLGIGIVSALIAEKALALGSVAIVDAETFPVARPFFAVLPRGSVTRAAEAFLEHLRASA